MACHDGFVFTRAALPHVNYPRRADYTSLSESYIIFVCDFDFFHIGKAAKKRISFLKDIDIPHEIRFILLHISTQIVKEQSTPSRKILGHRGVAHSRHPATVPDP